MPYATETRISKKLHDKLVNDVYYVPSFAETQDLSTEGNKETLLKDLDNIYSRTRNISKKAVPSILGLIFCQFSRR